MLLPFGPAELTDERWESLFQSYVQVNHSHWRGPPADVVRRILADKGAYSFSVPAMGTWTSRFQLRMEGDGFHVEFVKNPDLSGKMRERLDEMEKRFLLLISRVA